MDIIWEDTILWLVVILLYRFLIPAKLPPDKYGKRYGHLPPKASQTYFKLVAYAQALVVTVAFLAAFGAGKHLVYYIFMASWFVVCISHAAIYSYYLPWRIKEKMSTVEPNETLQESNFALSEGQAINWYFRQGLQLKCDEQLRVEHWSNCIRIFFGDELLEEIPFRATGSDEARAAEKDEWDG